MALTDEQRRPSRLLNKQQTAPKKKISEMNASESPLLRLPPELRNRIYGYVLGGNILHVSRNGWSQITVTICRRPDLDAPRADAIREQGAEDVTFRYRNHHASLGCTLSFHKDNGARKLDVVLLQTCRHIHREAALLPHLLSTFAFDCDLMDFSVFTDTLIPSQRRAIRAVTLVTCGRTIPRIKSPSQISRLTGLTHVTLSVIT
ncbi:hypothetical protein LTR37_000462 [Vermiconidia calcicola]|uniref:Uncharacterized protein n=1 Tax=Vermiconidia calcicola TaxID=1690605 RepID=A0ACC3P094_9PEZI|nr:hypothetical protein LTR37_000462 [Vermiconidia calcicola]